MTLSDRWHSELCCKRVKGEKRGESGERVLTKHEEAGRAAVHKIPLPYDSEKKANKENGTKRECVADRGKMKWRLLGG